LPMADKRKCMFCSQTIHGYPYNSRFDNTSPLCQICYLRESNFVSKAPMQLKKKAKEMDWSHWRDIVLAWSGSV